DSTSQWLTAHPAALNAIRKVLGKADYKAHAGVYTGGANAVYWVQKTYTHPNGDVVVQNITEGAKIKVEQVSMTVEPDLLYPLLRGRDVQRWHAQPSAWIIVPRLKPQQVIPLSEMQVKFPKTYAYLKRFAPTLLQRKDAITQGALKRGEPFYFYGAVDDYTFAPWKVVWTRIGSIQAAVVSSVSSDDEKVVIPQETITLVPCNSSEEAHYICAIVNSVVFQFAAESYSQKGGKSMGTMHLLDHIRIPRYDPNNPVHREFADLSRQAHVIVARGDTARLGQVEKKIDELAAQVWGLTESEMDAIRQSLQTTDSDENNDLDS
ncbi:hypothetical protein NW837_13195, partial [Synechococcus sp. R6-10]|uniref:hypothetical protein n=1 Tax=Synechococcus sp. R6-10 TaxID=2291956 RepID=UPI0039C42009